MTPGPPFEYFPETLFPGENLRDVYLKQSSVIIAEDNEEMRGFIVGILCGAYHVIGAVSDGEDLVQSAACLRPDVIVSDIAMPWVNGPAARKKLRAQGLAIPFVFVSWFGKEEVALLNRYENPAAFVYKGELQSHLGRAVSAVLFGRRYLSPHYRK
jgi:DNA-binding NarL/FixJ family response regulator